MHIMYMLGIISIVFLIAMFLMCFFREKLSNPIIDPLMVGACAVFFFSWTFAMYKHNGLRNGFMTFDNISPYISTIIILTPFMSKKVKEYAYSAIAYFAFGMFVAMFISPEFEYVFNYHQDTKLIHVSEATCHLIMGVYGFYLILSNKVKVNMKTLKRASIFIYSSIAFGIFLNLVFHRSNFGMDMYGDYSIYFIDIFGSFWATLVAYLVGVFGTLVIGMLVCHFFDWLSRPKNQPQIEEIPGVKRK